MWDNNQVLLSALHFPFKLTNRLNWLYSVRKTKII